MVRLNGAEYLFETGVMTIVRGISAESAIPLGNALYQGGVRVMEITMNTPGASQMIHELRQHFGDEMWIGAGTVISDKDCQEAYETGAQFFVTPNVDERVIQFGVERGLPVFPGAMTPTEVSKAYEAGATAVKIFPSSSLGAGYVRELQGPLGHIPLMAVGGISAMNAAEFFHAGVQAIGLGGQLVDKHAIAAKDFNRIERSAKELVDLVQKELKNLGRDTYFTASR